VGVSAVARGVRLLMAGARELTPEADSPLLLVPSGEFEMAVLSLVASLATALRIELLAGWAGIGERVTVVDSSPRFFTS